MVLFGPKISIALSGPSTFLTGGSVTGTINIDTKSSLDVLHVDVMLRCRERVSLIALNGSSAYRTGAVWQRLSLRSTVFPSTAVEGSFSQSSSNSSAVSSSTELTSAPRVVREAEELWKGPVPFSQESVTSDSRFTKTYTLKKGLHKLPFEFLIPLDVPSSIRVDDENGIFWTLETKMYRTGVLALEKTAGRVLEVFRADRVSWNPALIDHASGESDITVYSPGYMASKRAVMRDKSQTAKFKQKATVDLHIYSPVDGLFPLKPVSVMFGLACAHASLLMVTSVEIFIRRRAYARPEPARQQEFSKVVQIIKLNGLRASFKEAQDLVNKELESKVLSQQLTETHRSPLITVTYKLVTEVTVQSRENPSKTDKLKLSIPIAMHSSQAQNLLDEEEHEVDQLPQYTA